MLKYLGVKLSCESHKQLHILWRQFLDQTININININIKFTIIIELSGT